MSERNRIVGIDSLKGFAILTVVFGHCIDWILKAEIYPNFNQILYVLFNFIYSFHMPLFFMISGLLFWYSKVYSRFKIKVIDFIWIYFIWEFIIWFFKYIFSNHATNTVDINTLFSIIYKPIGPLWYLYVLICFYIFFSKKKIEKVSTRVLIVTAVVSITAKFISVDIGIIQRILYHMYFFVLGGYIAQRYNQIDQIKRNCIVIMILIAIILFFVESNLVDSFLKHIIVFSVANLLSISCLCLFFNKHKLIYFEMLGVNCMYIYVIHCFIIAFVTIFFKRMPQLGISLYFFLSVVLGVGIPLLIAELSKHISIIKLLFSPYKTIKIYKSSF